jgi:hypothetical protein
MKTLFALALVAVIASCHFDKLFTGGGESPFSHDPPAGLAFGPGPDNGRAGQPLAPVLVTVVDSAGTRVAGADSLITIALGANPSSAQLTGTVTTHAVNGLARFADLIIDKAGTAYTLTATVAGLKSDTSDAFNVMPPPATTGSVRVTTSTTGASPDVDGYSVAVDNGTSQHIDPNNNTGVIFPDLAVGSHTAVLSGVAGNCTVTGGNSKTVNVSAGGTEIAAFDISCPTPPPTTGDLTVNVTTTGTSADPDGYTLTVQGGPSKTIGTTGSVTFNALPAGSQTVVLSGVADNCTVSGGPSRTVDVPAGGVGSASFAIDCPTPPNRQPSVTAGSNQNEVTGISVSLQGASFSDPDHDAPWTVTINWGDGNSSQVTMPSEGSISASHTYFVLLPRDFQVTVTVEDAHGARGSATKTISVALL